MFSSLSYPAAVLSMQPRSVPPARARAARAGARGATAGFAKRSGSCRRSLVWTTPTGPPRYTKQTTTEPPETYHDGRVRVSTKSGTYVLYLVLSRRRERFRDRGTRLSRWRHRGGCHHRTAAVAPSHGSRSPVSFERREWLWVCGWSLIAAPGARMRLLQGTCSRGVLWHVCPRSVRQARFCMQGCFEGRVRVLKNQPLSTLSLFLCTSSAVYVVGAFLSWAFPTSCSTS